MCWKPHPGHHSLALVSPNKSPLGEDINLYHPHSFQIITRINLQYPIDRLFSPAEAKSCSPNLLVPWTQHRSRWTNISMITQNHNHLRPRLDKVNRRENYLSSAKESLSQAIASSHTASIYIQTTIHPFSIAKALLKMPKYQLPGPF
jgi:hypothetical protein